MAENFAEDVADVGKIDVVALILDVVCRTTGLGFSAVARVTEDRWIACAVRDGIEFGLRPGGELPVETTICHQIRQSGQLVAIDHAAEDAIYSSHATPKLYGFQSYISVPIRRPDGRFFGTLCAIDPRPARVDTPEIIGTLKLFADLIGFHLDVQDRLKLSESALLDERRTAELREQFIAVLGHDLRNPLASIEAGVTLLLKQPEPDKARHILALIRSSTARMAEMIDNVLDFARGRLGGGLSIQRDADPQIETALRHVVAEVQSAWPAREIVSDIAIDAPIICDSARIAQLASNLLANAMTHGDAASPVRISARSDTGGLEIAVSNSGAMIPAATIDRLFLPFTRASDRSSQQGLGLGLYIASEIAKAHGGALGVESSAAETRFVFSMYS